MHLKDVAQVSADFPRAGARSGVACGHRQTSEITGIVIHGREGTIGQTAANAAEQFASLHVVLEKRSG